MAITGIAFNVQRFSIEDGPGIRTTVFLKGCPLRCQWCHNPEGLSRLRELVWYDKRCIGAHRCLAACPEDALTLAHEGIVINRDRCTVCGLCVEACPAAAMEVLGRDWTAEALYAEVVKDQIFFETSGGGVTISGGEPLMQAAFVSELLSLCKGGGIATALDTCGSADWRVFKAVLPFVDLVLYDLKVIDRRRHRIATGIYPDRILANARRIARAGIAMWVRTPIIPGFTDDVENIAAIGSFIRDRLPTVERWDLLAFNNLASPKYYRLGLPYPLEGARLMRSEEMERLRTVAAAAVGEIVHWSGATEPIGLPAANSQPPRGWV